MGGRGHGFNQPAIGVALPEISIVMPVRNGAATLPRAVESLRRQTLTDWELVAVDDGSTDATASMLRDWAARDVRIRHAPLGASGLVAALNAGLEAARGRFIARMDADDECHPERLAEQFRFLQAHPEAGLVGCQVEFGGDRAAAGGYALHVDWLNRLLTPEQISLNRFVEAPFAHPSVLFRRDLIDRHGGYCDGEFPEDYELWLRWLDAGVVMAKVPRPLLVWHDSPNRLSRTDARYAAEAFYRCKAEYLARWLERQATESRQLLIWGAGRPTRKRAEFLAAHGIRIDGYIDIDPRKVGRALAGRRVIGPEELPPPSTAFVIGYVAKRGAREFARSQLRQRGFVEGRDFLMAA